MRRRGALAVLFALVLAGCASYRLIRDGALDAGAAERVKARLTALRGLRFETPVPIIAVNPAEARTMLEKELRARFTPGEMRKLAQVYTALGLLPDGTDLEHAILDLYGAQVAGFYEPIERRMVLVEGALAVDPLTRMVEGIFRRDLTGELVLAHELTHALQDHHFGLDVGRSDVGEDDALLARHAVYEGDATLAGFAVVLGQLRPGTALKLAAKLESVPGQLAATYPDIPAVIRDTVIFQYVAGVNFVSWAYQSAGWEGVNALLARPPLSTEQVMHPEKYFVRPEPPLTIHVGATAPYLQAGWEVADEGTLGEFTTRLLFERFLDRPRAVEVAAGWDGDRLVALTRGTDVALVWLTSWDSERDATEFFDAWATALATKHKDANPVASAATISALAGGTPYYLGRRGAKVLAIEGTLEADPSQLAERVWRRSTYEPAMPWVPIDLGVRPSNVRSAAKQPASASDGVAGPSADRTDTPSGPAPCGHGAGCFSRRTHYSDGLLAGG